MNHLSFDFANTTFCALPSGGLWWPDTKILTVSDLHLGKSERIARRNGAMLPPYETRDTLARLETDIAQFSPITVICLGDSFDDLDAANALAEAETTWISQLQAGRRWIWIEGNHDPGPVQFGGTHLGQFRQDPLTFRHIAKPSESNEVSGHYHPKTTLHARGTSITRSCFLVDNARIILPAYGTYTGGLRTTSPVLTNLMAANARAILTGPTPIAIPMQARSPTGPRPSGDKTG